MRVFGPLPWSEDFEGGKVPAWWIGAGRFTIADGADGKTLHKIAAYQPALSVPSTGRAQLVLVNVMLGRKLGTGRSFEEAWRNLRGEVGPLVPGAGAEAVLEGGPALDAARRLGVQARRFPGNGAGPPVSAGAAGTEPEALKELKHSRYLGRTHSQMRLD